MDISIQSVSKSYVDGDHTVTVLDDISYSFPAGRSVAIVGRSGIGKSTLLHILGGLDLPSRGNVFFGEQNISTFTPDALAQFRGKHVGFVFQFHHLLPEFSALENVAFPLLIAGMSDREALEKGRALLERFQLSSRADHRPGELSGGEQQRVAIARALISEPAVILADEPTGNLDARTADDVSELLRTSCSELGTTLIIVTHSNELASSMDVMLEMHPGGTLTKVDSTAAKTVVQA